jgi:aryl carrier-like protein
MRADGILEFIGRTDDQIKLFGNRIDPGEVEALIDSMPGVVRSVVCLDRNVNPSRLVAFVECSSLCLAAEDLRTALGKQLPAAAIPAVFAFVDALPSLPSGKIDRKRLPWKDAHFGMDRGRRVAPDSPQEKLLADAWRETLNVDEGSIDVEQSFFSAGGDSIRSIEFVMRARRCGLGLRVEEVFEHRTIRALARHAKTLQNQIQDEPERRPNEAAAALADVTGVEEVFPLSSLLSTLVAASSRRTDYRTYVTSLRVAAHFDRHALLRASVLLMDRHPFLRSAIYAPPDRKPWQQIVRDVSPDVRIVDWRHMESAEQAGGLTAWMEAERAVRFIWLERHPRARGTA